MKEGDDCKKIMISRDQYKKLVDFVDAKFDKDKTGTIILFLQMLFTVMMMHSTMHRENTAS
jgi:hypothetical protein